MNSSWSKCFFNITFFFFFLEMMWKFSNSNLKKTIVQKIRTHINCIVYFCNKNRSIYCLHVFDGIVDTLPHHGCIHARYQDIQVIHDLGLLIQQASLESVKELIGQSKQISFCRSNLTYY